MSEYETSFATMAQTLGKNLAMQRRRLGLTQKQLARDICSQGLISNIERGNYVPNAILLGQICNRLKMSIDHALLNHYYKISHREDFNETVEQLCNQHLYQQMQDYLEKSELADHLRRDDDLQIYYYYHACSVYQLTKDAQVSLRELNLALSFTYSPHQAHLTSLEMVIMSCIDFVESESNINHEFKRFKRLESIILNDDNLTLDPNYSLIFYQYALTLFHHGEKIESIAILQTGIKWATDHNVTFMLADFFFLLSKEYITIKDDDNARTATQKYQVLESLFHQPVNQTID